MTTFAADIAPAGGLRVETLRDGQAVRVIIRGEVDIANVERLEAALAGIELGGPRSVHMHVADLDFCDLAGLRQITAFARRATEAGHEIRTCGAKPILHRVACLMSVEHELGLA